MQTLIISGVVTGIVGLFFSLLKLSLGQNLKQINDSIAGFNLSLSTKVNKETYELKMTKIDEDFRKNWKDHDDFDSRIRNSEIWEARQNGKL